MANQYPAKVAGKSGKNNSRCLISSRSTNTSMASDITQLTQKKADMFALINSLSSCCKSKAIGGPPIEVLVPINPDKNPAESIKPELGLSFRLLRLNATAATTERPTQSASCSMEIQTKSIPPAIVPGIRPRMANFKPEKDMDRQCLAAITRDRVSAEIVIGAGT